MRSRIDIRELRDRLTAAIRRVRRGETPEVTEPVAILSPVGGDRIERLIAGGDVTAPAPLEKPLRRFAVIGDLTASEAIAEDRAQR